MFCEAHTKHPAHQSPSGETCEDSQLPCATCAWAGGKSTVVTPHCFDNIGNLRSHFALGECVQEKEIPMGPNQSPQAPHGSDLGAKRRARCLRVPATVSRAALHPKRERGSRGATRSGLTNALLLPENPAALFRTKKHLAQARLLHDKLCWASRSPFAALFCCLSLRFDACRPKFLFPRARTPRG